MMEVKKAGRQVGMQAVIRITDWITSEKKIMPLGLVNK